ncbi:MAG TPA: hypothetical protein VGR70_05080 [Stellaceae bacterium]|nr:hypothetical protein [Stellaceae bacterium]
MLALNPPKFLTKQEEDGWKQAMALARNARGRAEMYYTDYFCRPADKLKRLQSALKDLEWAENKFESEITYKCDVASCHMRLGYWWARSEARDILYNMNSEPNFEPESPEAVASDAEFKMAEEQLKELLEQSLSGYGFGEFELGRAYRLQERFDEAIQRLEKAHDIGEEERDISDARITREIALARARSTTYP